MLIIKSILIGIGKIIPGISGSVLAMTMGLYEPIIDAISNFFSNPKKNIKFLFQVFLGISIAIIFGSKVLYYFVTNYYTLTLFAIVGFILGSIPKLLKKTNYTKKNVIFTILPFLLIILPTYFLKIPTKYTISNFMIVILGFLEAATTIIPGISGTAVLINIGYYNLNLKMISTININYLLFYAIGIIIGILSLVKIIDYLLKNKQNFFLLVVNGFIFASIFSIVLRIIESLTFNNFILGLILLTISSFISYLNT